MPMRHGSRPARELDYLRPEHARLQFEEFSFLALLFRMSRLHSFEHVVRQVANCSFPWQILFEKNGMTMIPLSASLRWPYTIVPWPGAARVSVYRCCTRCRCVSLDFHSIGGLLRDCTVELRTIRTDNIEMRM